MILVGYVVLSADREISHIWLLVLQSVASDVMGNKNTRFVAALLLYNFTKNYHNRFRINEVIW